MQARILIYIDILGFSNYIKSLAADEVDIVRSIYIEIIKKYTQQEKTKDITEEENAKLPQILLDTVSKNRKIISYNFQSTMFSDSILVSYPLLIEEKYFEDDPPQFRDGLRKTNIVPFIQKAQEIQRIILENLGLLTRGVIHIGPLCHEDNYFVKKAFIEAVELENKLENPTVYLTEKVIEEYKEFLIPILKKGKNQQTFRKDEGRIHLYPALSTESKCMINKYIQAGINNTDKKIVLKWLWLQNILDELDRCKKNKP